MNSRMNSKQHQRFWSKMGVNPDARCYYTGLIEGIIKEWRAHASVLPHAATREIRDLWNRIIQKLADEECNFDERTFYDLVQKFDAKPWLLPTF